VTAESDVESTIEEPGSVGGADDGAPPESADAGAADPELDGRPLSVEVLIDDLDKVTAERDGHLDDLRRVSAEFANFRKQVDRRNSDVVQQAAAGLVVKLLPVLDACDAALDQGATDVEPIRMAMLETLKKEGLEPLDVLGAPFDPESHEAVLTEEGDGEPVVTEVLRTGYALRGRVVRPAMVKVRG